MSFLLKDPDAVLDYLIDWAAEYLGADVLTNSEWSVEPSEPGGVSVVPGEFDGRTAVVKASGGIPGHVYRLVNTGVGGIAMLSFGTLNFTSFEPQLAISGETLVCMIGTVTISISQTGDFAESWQIMPFIAV